MVSQKRPGPEVSPELITTCWQLLIKGAEPEQIADHLRKSEAIDKPTAQAAIAAAVERIRLEHNASDPGAVALAHARRNQLLLEAWRVNDYATALRILQDLAKLDRLYESPAPPADDAPTTPPPLRFIRPSDAAAPSPNPPSKSERKATPAKGRSSKPRQSSR